MLWVHVDAPLVPPQKFSACKRALKLNCRAAWSMHLEAQEELTKHHWAPKETTEGFILYSCISAFLVIMAGLMSGLTLGLMSLDSLDLEVSCTAWAVPCCPAGCSRGCCMQARCVCLALHSERWRSHSQSTAQRLRTAVQQAAAWCCACTGQLACAAHLPRLLHPVA